MNLPTLFQRDSKGKVRQWRVWTDGDAIVVEHGVQNGKLQEKRTVAKPKNKGKVNETTGESQALLEAQSKWTAQVDRDDYHEDVNLAGCQTRPMLAHDYHKVGHRVDWNRVIAQPKLDGLRLVAGHRYRKDDHRYQEENGIGLFEMMTRKGEVHNVDHLIDSAHSLFRRANELLIEEGYPECLGVDGEVYLHGRPLPWINSRAKKYYKGETETLEYHLFDLVAPGVPFEVRYSILEQAFGDMFLSETNGDLVLVPCDLLPDAAWLGRQHGTYIEAGYEGLMIRHTDGAYAVGDRSADLFKYKLFFDEECRISNVWEDKNGNAMLTVVRRNGVVVKVTPKRTHDERKAMLEQPGELFGKWITVKYQGETPDGSLQFPVGLTIRECDDNGEPIV